MVLAALAAVYLYRGHVSRERVLSMENFTEARVDYVIDGDTMIVTADGATERVRLLGIDCEESVLEDESLNTEKGRQEAAFVKKLVAEGDTVYLQKDVTDRDRYERLLRYVWLALPDDPAGCGLLGYLLGDFLPRRPGCRHLEHVVVQFHGQLTAHKLREAFGDGQAQAAAFGAA